VNRVWQGLGVDCLIPAAFSILMLGLRDRGAQWFETLPEFFLEF